MTLTSTSRDRLSEILFYVLSILLKQEQHPEWEVIKQNSVSDPLISLMCVSFEKQCFKNKDHKKYTIEYLALADT